MLIGHAKLNISTANLKTQASFSYMNFAGNRLPLVLIAMPKLHMYEGLDGVY